MIDQRVALISGASRGIGAAIAERLVQEGWAVLLGMRAPVQPDWSAKAQVQGYDAAVPGAEADWVAAAPERSAR